MLCKELIAVCSENHTKHTHCGQNAEFLNVKPGGRYSDHKGVNNTSPLLLRWQTGVRSIDTEWGEGYIALGTDSVFHGADLPVPQGVHPYINNKKKNLTRTLRHCYTENGTRPILTPPPATKPGPRWWKRTIYRETGFPTTTYISLTTWNTAAFHETCLQKCKLWHHLR